MGQKRVRDLWKQQLGIIVEATLLGDLRPRLDENGCVLIGISYAIVPVSPGTEYDLMDEASLLLDPEIEVVVYSSGLKAIKWIEPRYGLWSLQTYSSSTYSVSVSGNSTLSFLGGFSILDPSPPHPHYRAAEGNPLVSELHLHLLRSC